ncbi:MAG: hypothetical protein CL952_00360 [Erythrobacteraceae bacterium]|nr:hypothetical protein [Erythrobacteraceae bacterium]
MNSGNLTTEPATLPMSIWPAETFPFEPVQGWIHRAAERNYAFSTDTFVNSLGVSGRDWDYDELLKVVQQMPIDGYAELEHCTPKRSNEGYEICGHKVPIRFVSKGERRVCPQCLEEKRYVRAWFDFVPIKSCPHHNLALIEGLPNDPLDWRHTEIGWTRSGVKVGAKHATPQIASELDHYLLGILSGEEVSQADHLRSVSLDKVLTASICVGKLYRGDENHLSTTTRVRELCQLGFDPLSKGNEAIAELLRQAEWLQKGYERSRFEARCYSVTKLLSSIDNEHLRHLIADAFARVRVQNGLVTPSGRLSKYDGEDGSHNLKGAALRLGLTSHTLRGLLRKLAINVMRCKRTRAQRLTHEQLVAVRIYIKEALGPDDAARLLGCTAQDLQSLVARRLLRADFQMAGLSYYTRSDLQAFMDEIISARVSEPCLDMQLIRPFAKQKGISLAEACSHILRAKNLLILEHDPRAPFFEGLKVADAKKAFGRAGVRPLAQVRDAITYAEAAARLGTKHNAVKGLIKAGLIATEKVGNNEHISEQSLKRFEDRYVKAAAYGPILECPSTVVLKQLRTEGVVPINDWKGAGARFVDWQEVTCLTGLPRPTNPDLAAWQSLQTTLAKHIAIHDVPATTRVTNGPAIEVRATSGRWSFLIEQDGQSGQYTLVSHFTARRQPGRLKRVLEASVDPSEIWPGATVRISDRGGFVIEDYAYSNPEEAEEASLIALTIDRAHQIHRIL